MRDSSSPHSLVDDMSSRHALRARFQAQIRPGTTVKVKEEPLEPMLVEEDLDPAYQRDAQERASDNTLSKSTDPATRSQAYCGTAAPTKHMRATSPPPPPQSFSSSSTTTIDHGSGGVSACLEFDISRWPQKNPDPRYSLRERLSTSPSDLKSAPHFAPTADRQDRAKRKKEKSSSYPCRSCNITFTRDADLSRHQRTKHDSGDKPSCPYCKKVYCRVDSMQRHVRLFCKRVGSNDEGNSTNVSRSPVAEQAFKGSVTSDSKTRELHGRLVQWVPHVIRESEGDCGGERPFSSGILETPRPQTSGSASRQTASSCSVETTLPVKVPHDREELRRSAWVFLVSSSHVGSSCQPSIPVVGSHTQLRDKRGYEYVAADGEDIPEKTCRCCGEEIADDKTEEHQCVDELDEETDTAAVSGSSDTAVEENDDDTTEIPASGKSKPSPPSPRKVQSVARVFSLRCHVCGEWFDRLAALQEHGVKHLREEEASTAPPLQHYRRVFKDPNSYDSDSGSDEDGFSDCDPDEGSFSDHDLDEVSIRGDSDLESVASDGTMTPQKRRAVRARASRPSKRRRRRYVSPSTSFSPSPTPPDPPPCQPPPPTQSTIVRQGSDQSVRKCPDCHTCFSRLHDLRRHIETVHTRARQTQCERCKRRYARPDSFKRHEAYCRSEMWSKDV